MNDVPVAIIVIAALAVLYGIGDIGHRLSPKSEEFKEIHQAVSGAAVVFIVLGSLALAVIIFLPMIQVPGG